MSRLAGGFPKPGQVLRHGHRLGPWRHTIRPNGSELERRSQGIPHVEICRQDLPCRGHPCKGDLRLFQRTEVHSPQQTIDCCNLESQSTTAALGCSRCMAGSARGAQCSTRLFTDTVGLKCVNPRLRGSKNMVIDLKSSSNRHQHTACVRRSPRSSRSRCLRVLHTPLPAWASLRNIRFSRLKRMFTGARPPLKCPAKRCVMG